MAKLHFVTKNQCLICEDDGGIILHKTKRQTHVLCVDCAEGYLTPIFKNITNLLAISNNPEQYLTVKCPGSYRGLKRNKCSHKINIKKLIVPDNSTIATDLVRILFCDVNAGRYICRHCFDLVDVGVYYFDNDLHCQSCNTSWCKTCNIQPYHTGFSCLEHEVIMNSTENGKKISELQKKGELKFCPVCKAPTTKEKNKDGKDIGCNKIKCLCGIYWCFLCKDVNIDYNHYSSGNCENRLWEGVDIEQ